MAAALARYDLLLLRRSFADAFGRVRDRVLLALVTIVLALWLRDAAARALPLLPPEAAALAGLAGPAAFVWTRAAARRLVWFSETSVLACEALRPQARAAYFARAQLPLLALLSAAVLILGALSGQWTRPGTLGFLSYGAGVALAAAAGQAQRSKGVRRLASRKRQGSASAFLILLGHQTFAARRPLRAAASLVALAALASFAIVRFSGPQPDGVRIAAALLPSMVLLLATARNAPETVGLLAFAGHPAGSVAASVCALPAANFSAVSAALLLFRPHGWAEMLGALLLLHLFAALVATARAWLSPGRPARRVDVQVQLEIVGLVLVASLVAPLAPLALAWRLWRLRRHYTKLLWIQS